MSDKPVYELRLGEPLQKSIPPAKLDPATQKFVDEYRGGVVTIIQGGTTGRFDYGTGFFIDPDGDIATNAHLVLPAELPSPVQVSHSKSDILPELTVITDSGVTSPAEIVAIDEHDVAIIKINGPTPSGAEPLKMASDTTTSSDSGWRLAMGHPLMPRRLEAQPLYVSQGQDEGNASTVDVDHISYNARFGRSACADDAFKRFTEQPQNSEFTEQALGQSSMHIEHGFSGGPIFNNQEEVVQIAQRGDGPVNRTTYGIPITYVKALANSPSAYTFSYAPDVTRPGYQILTDIQRKDGQPFKIFGNPASYFAFKECSPRGPLDNARD
jgi:S1-C subfamily serine protease